MAGDTIRAGNPGAETRRHVMEGINMRRLVRHLFSGRNMIAYLLLLFSLCTVAYGLSESVSGIKVTALSILAVIGSSYGWLCAVTRMRDWQVALLTVTLGITGSIYYFANLTRPLIALLISIWNTAIVTVTGSANGSRSISSINFALQQMNAQLGTLFNRIIEWMNLLRSGQVGHDTLIINLAWSVAFWLAAAWAGWWYFRHHSAIVSILPAIAMLAGSLNYVAANPLHLVPLVGTMLILKAITSYDLQENYWIEHKIDYAEDIRFDLKILIPALALGFMLISMIAPSVSIRQIIDLSQQITQKYQGRVDSIAKSIGLVPQSQEAFSFSSWRNPGLPQSHLLGSGPELSKEVVMVIETGDYPPAPSVESLPAAPPHYYWRSLTYDVYTGHGWETSSIDVTNYSTNQPVIEGTFPITGTLRLMNQSVRFTQDLGSLLHSAGQLISVDHDYKVAWRITPVDTSTGNQDQIADEFGATFDGNEYKVDSFISTLSLMQLRSASGDIPTWIQNRYLPLPDSLPDRVRQLATKLTGDQPTAYDQAAAIESYLRTYTYTLDVPYPPSDRDVVDYFLFDLKRGYCDYYATAMVVLARSVGLPARLVTGYSSGVYDPVNAYYIVTASNAHSWAEVYLAGIGWVEFEPTAGLPAIQHPSSQTANIELPQFKPVLHFNLFQWLGSGNHHWMEFIGGIIGILLLGMILWVISEKWRLNRHSPSLVIVQLFHRLFIEGQTLVNETHMGDTPIEFSNRLMQRLKIVGAPHRWNDYFQEGVQETERLTSLYTQTVYSSHAPGLSDQKTAIRLWGYLRRRLWLAARLDTLTHLLSRIKPDHKKGNTHV